MLAVEGKTKRLENRRCLDLRSEPKGVTTRFLILAKTFDRIKQLEDHLRIRQIIDAIPQVVVVFGPNGSVLYGNESVLEYTGLSSAEIRMGNFCAIHPDDVERVRDERQTGLA